VISLIEVFNIPIADGNIGSSFGVAVMNPANNKKN
jgi:hypothetical protein